MSNYFRNRTVPALSLGELKGSYHKKSGYMKQHICECGEKFLGSAIAKYCPECKVERINGHIKTNTQKRRGK